MNNPRSLAGSTLLLALAALSGPSAAVEPANFEIRNNADLLALCSASPTDPNYAIAINFCHGVGIGMYRYHQAIGEGKGMEPTVCIPEGTTRNQNVARYVAYSEAHPEYGTSSVGDVLLKFLLDTYPCAKPLRPAGADKTQGAKP